MYEHKNCISKARLVACAVKKYGWKNILPEILALGPFEAIRAMEEPTIKLFKCRAPHGYNLGIGGTLGIKPKLSSKAKKRQSAIAKKLWHNPAYRARVIAGVTGTIKSPEAREKMRKKKIGFIFTKSHRAKLSAARIGYKHAPEMRAKVSAAQKEIWRKRKNAA